ncbi:putative hydrolase [Medicago truncatula]|uniref:Putative hydrolase n=1 Tax=Medicago truncatula TaxID=3880 RepID=A0A396J721_MEDTR|nr:putative hydrolase [Medicago truncatula]
MTLLLEWEVKVEFSQMSRASEFSGTAILPNVGGYLPIIEQGMTTAGDCRYRQAIPVGFGGRLDIDTNYGIRKAFLPRGKRKYTPLRQPTAQQVLIDKISAGNHCKSNRVGKCSNNRCNL